MNHLLNEEQFSAGFLPAWFEARRRHALEQWRQAMTAATSIGLPAMSLTLSVGVLRLTTRSEMFCRLLSGLNQKNPPSRIVPA